MADPTVTELRKQARIRSASLRAAEKGLLTRSATMQRSLNAYILNFFLPTLDVSNNQIKNTNANLKKVNNASGIKAFMKKVVNVAMLDYYDTQFNTLTGDTTRYFSAFEPTRAAQDRIINRGTTLTEGFIDELFDNNQIVRAIQQTARNGVTSGQNLTDVKNLLTEQIKGKEDKFGLIKAYHSQNGRDQFQAYSRGLDDDFSKALNLNYAIYAGGEIKTTRQFCDDRNGEVFNRETILSWNHTPATWQGRKPNNNILIDMGGYNCRHDFDWISFALARRINPNIEKSKFDKK
jgi:hypothetical protein